MGLSDKLNEKTQVKTEETPIYQTNNNEDLNELKELLKQTNDLNDLMRGYIRTNMDKSSAQKMTFDHEITNIKTTSKQVMTEMHSILTKQERLLNDNRETLQKALTDSQETTSQNVGQVLQQMTMINKQIEDKLTEISNTTKTEMESMNKRNQQSLNEMSQRTSNLIGKAQRGVLITEWLDALKYGGTAAVLGSAILSALYYFFVM